MKIVVRLQSCAEVMPDRLLSSLLCIKNQTVVLLCKYEVTQAGLKHATAKSMLCVIAGLTGKAVLSEMNPETFSLALSWMYGTIDRSLSAREAIDLFMVSDRLGLISLHRSCYSILMDSLRQQPSSELIEEVEELRQYAKLLGLEPLAYVSSQGLGSAGLSLSTHVPTFVMQCSKPQGSRSHNARHLYLNACCCIIRDLMHRVGSAVA